MICPNCGKEYANLKIHFGKLLNKGIDCSKINT